MDFLAVAPSPEWIEVASAWADDDAIKTSIATSTSRVVYSGVDLNGAIGAGDIFPSKKIDITTSASASTYVTTQPIVIVGKDNRGDDLTQNVLLTQAGGNETVSSVKGFSSVTSITVPAQLTTSGTFKFGIGDIALANPGQAFEAGVAGVFKLVTSTGRAKSITLAVNNVRRIAVGGVDKTTAAFPFILYL